MSVDRLCKGNESSDVKKLCVESKLVGVFSLETFLILRTCQTNIICA